jgi:DNA-binding HxlR family transcriptional regulator
MEPDREALAAALEDVGDRWSLLIVDALLAGARRFGDLTKELPGIAPTVLSQRLKRLERIGIVIARPYSRRPPRLSYALTARGSELGDAVRLLTSWGAAMPEGRGIHHEACGTPLETRWYCPTCAGIFERAESEELRSV